MLGGKIIINTRPLGSTDVIGNALRKLGANVLSMPLIEIIPIEISQKQILDITKTNTYQWLVFTSKNAVDILFNQLRVPSSSASLPFKTAVFGKRTAMALREKGFKPDLAILQNTSADLLVELFPVLHSNEKVLLVLGDLAPNLLEDRLKSKANTNTVSTTSPMSPKKFLIPVDSAVALPSGS